jgi:hypothetical protein
VLSSGEGRCHNSLNLSAGLTPRLASECSSSGIDREGGDSRRALFSFIQTSARSPVGAAVSLYAAVRR